MMYCVIIVFPQDEIEWYDKHPSKVTKEEFQSLLNNFVKRLSEYDEIFFYRNPGRFHPLYKKLIEEAENRGLKIILFSHLKEIR